MKNIYKWAYILLAIGLLSSCKDNEIFEKEMYKNVVSLVSTNYYNTFVETVDLNNEETTTYIAATAGGTLLPSSNLVVDLIENLDQLNIYNWSLHDAEESLYAKVLPAANYTIEDPKITIRAGERSGRTAVKIRTAGLSPDVVYFISLKVADGAAAEVNANKNSILYQVALKNNYASQTEESLYSMRGLLNETITAANKKMFPLTKNRVRIQVGTETYEPNLTNINNTSIILELAADNKISILPYKDIPVVQLAGDATYNNTYRLEETAFGSKFHVFLLHYQYTLANKVNIMKEELRIEIKD